MDFETVQDEVNHFRTGVSVADQIVDEACAKGVITQEESAAMERAKALRRQVIMVDDFPKDLGRTEIHQTTQPVTHEALRGRTFSARNGPTSSACCSTCGHGLLRRACSSTKPLPCAIAPCIDMHQAMTRSIVILLT